jgi:hypothetical protein
MAIPGHYGQWARFAATPGIARMLHDFNWLAADVGDVLSLWLIADALDKSGDHIGAERMAIKAADAGFESRLRELAFRWKDTDRHVKAAHILRFGLEANGVIASPWTFDTIASE